MKRSKDKINKKVRNSTQVILDGIKFKSKLEKEVYSTLKELGYNPKYEEFTYSLWKGFRPHIDYYDQETNGQRDKRISKNKSNDRSKTLVIKTNKLIDIRYTPDFYISFKDLHVFIEVKGKENDVFYIKKKLFVNYLNNLYIENGEKSIYFVIYTKKQLLQALDILKHYNEKIEDKMKNILSRIKDLIHSLPKKDVPIGIKFIEERNFEALKELVDSSLYKAYKNLQGNNPKEEYILLNRDDLNSLKYEVDTYISLIDGLDSESFDNDIYEYNGEELYE